MHYMYRVLVSLFLLGSVTTAKIATQVEAVNIAGKQRMLSYRMFRDYLMVSMGTNYKDPQGDLEKRIGEFTKALEALGAYSKDDKVRATLAKTKSQFDAFQKMIGKPFDASRAEAYLAKTVALRVAAHEVVLALSQGAGGEVVNKSGRLRVISQRISALYLLKTIAEQSEHIDTQMKKAMSIFRKEGLDFLKSSRLTDTQMQEKLKKLEKVYRFFGIMNDAETKTPIIACKKADKMLKTADALTRDYVEKLKK